MSTTTKPDVPVTVNGTPMLATVTEERSRIEASTGMYQSFMDGLRSLTFVVPKLIGPMSRVDVIHDGMRYRTESVEIMPRPDGSYETTLVTVQAPEPVEA